MEGIKMNISAVNCTPIKPQVSFGHDGDEQYDEISKITGQLNDQFIGKDEIKSPIEVVGSLALSGLLAYAGGKRIASMMSKTGMAQNLVGKLEKGLKATSTFIQDNANKLTESAAKSKRLGGVKSFIANTVKKGESAARNAYKSIVEKGIPEGADAVTATAKKFTNLGGLAALPIVGHLISKDSDGNGISDMIQKGKDPYAGTATKVNKAIATTSLLTDLVSMDI